jgi:hypothetical protein
LPYFIDEAEQLSRISLKYFENFEGFVQKLLTKMYKSNSFMQGAIVEIPIKRLVHISGLKISPFLQNLRPKLKNVPNYPI